MNVANVFSWIVCLVLVFAGSLFVGIAWKSWQTTGKIRYHGVATTAVVESLAPRPRKTGEIGTPTSVAPVLSYRAQDGHWYRYYSTTYTHLPAYAPGDSAQLWYLPENPRSATQEGPDSWILPLSFGVFGGVLLILGLPCLIRRLWRAWFLKN